MESSRLPNLGTWSQIPGVKGFLEVSENAFQVFDAVVEQNWSMLHRPVHHLFLRTMYIAKSTSYAIRLNSSWALVLPALALLRTRLEQTIVCSFLIHEEPEVGLERFVKHIPIGEFLHARRASQDESLAGYLPSDFNLEGLEQRAKSAQQELEPGFSIEEGRLDRKWTHYSLNAMAHRRDKLVNPDEWLTSESLEREYISFYKTASSIVHADASAVSFRFLRMMAAPDSTPVLTAKPDWALLTTAAAAHYDIIQCYETHRWLGLPDPEMYEPLVSDWECVRDEHI